MKIIRICPESWGANTYLMTARNDAFVIDPSPSAESIIKRAGAEGAHIRAIILTHGHFDHVISAGRLHDITGAPVMIHALDNEMLSDPMKNAYREVFGSDRAFREADATLRDGDILKLGDMRVEVLHTPGHTRGCICLYSDDILVTGDTLFTDGFGRVDFWGGSHSDMKRSLLRLNGLDHSLTIYPGHGDSSKLGAALSHIGFLNRINKPRQTASTNSSTTSRTKG